MTEEVKQWLSEYHPGVQQQLANGEMSFTNLTTLLIDFYNAKSIQTNVHLTKYRKAIDDIYNSGIAGRELVIKHFGIHHPGHGAISFATKEERKECVAWLQRIHGKCTEQNCKIKLVLEVYRDYLTWETFDSDMLFELLMHVLDKEDLTWREDWQLHKKVKHVNYS